MAEKVIVVKNQEGCFMQTLNLGCAFVFAIVGLLVLGSCWVMHKATEEAPERPSAASVRSYAKNHPPRPRGRRLTPILSLSCFGRPSATT